MHILKPNKVVADVNSRICFKGLSSVELIDLKEHLTFKNPAYAKVKQYSKWSYTKVPEYITYYDISGDNVIVPRGYSIKTNNVINNTKRVQVPYPQFCLQLRDTQKQAAEAYIKNNQTLDLNGIIQLPTGKGKSILGLYLAFALQQRTLIIVHKEDLVTGWKKDVNLCFGGKVECGIIKAKKREVGKQITIATVQTLSRMSAEELNNLTDKFGMVILDEMHHCPSSSYSVIQNFPARYLLGLTATPERSDGLEFVMNLYFGGFAFKYNSELDIEEKDILPVKVIKRECLIECTPVCVQISTQRGKKYEVIYFHTQGGKTLSDKEIKLTDIPYNERPKISYLSIDDFVVRDERVIEQVCEDICFEYNNKRSIVVFLTQKEHINIYFDRLVQLLGIDNVTKYYGDNKTNDLSLQIAEEKKPHVTLATYAKCSEGTNVKQWEVGFLVSSINNGKNVEQVAGRIRRTKQNKINPVLLYDYSFPNVYSLKNHYATRKERYNKLNFIMPVESPKSRSLFNRGFKK